MRVCARSARLAFAISIAAVAGIVRADRAGIDTVGSTDYPYGGMADVRPISGFKTEDRLACAAASADGSKAWIATSTDDYGPPASIAEIDLATMQKTRSLELAGGEFLAVAAAADPAGQFAYFAVVGANSQHRLIRVDAASFTRAGNTDLLPDDGVPNCIVIDGAGAYAYVAAINAEDQMTRIVKFNLAAFSREAALLMPVGDGSFQEGLVDPANAHAYFLNWTTGAPRLVKIRLSDFTRLDNLQLDFNIPRSMSIDPGGEYIYVAGGPTSQDGNGALRVHLDNFFTVDEINISGTTAGLESLTPSQDGTEGLALFSSGHTRLVNLETLDQGPLTPEPDHLAGSAVVLPLPGAPDRVLAVYNRTPPLADQIQFDGSRGAPVILEGGEYNFRALVQDADGKYCFAAMGDESQKFVDYHPLVRIRQKGLERTGRVVLGTGGNEPLQAASDGRYAYITAGRGADGDNLVAKVDLGQMTVAAAGPLPRSARTFFQSMTYSPFFDGIYFYANETSVAGYLGFLYSDLTSLTDITDFIDTQSMPSMVSNPSNGDLYFVLRPNNVIGRVQGSTGSINYSPSAFSNPRTLLRNPVTGRIYTATQGPTATIYDLEPPNLVEQQSLNVSALPGFSGASIFAAAIDPHGRFAVYQPSVAGLLKHDLANFQQTDFLPLPYLPDRFLIDPDGNVIFAASFFSDAIRRIRMTPRERAEGTRFELAAQSEVSTVNFYSHAAVGPRRHDVEPTGYDAVRLSSGFIDHAQGKAWFGTSQSPARVIEFDTASQTMVRTLTLEAGENNLSCGVIDPAGEFGYFGTETVPGRVVKVRLSDLTRIDSIPLDPAEINLEYAAIDPAGEFAYFSDSSQPPNIAKVRLSDFTRVAGLTLGGDDGNIRGMVIDPAGTVLYATATVGFFTAGIIRVDLATFTRGGAVGTSANFPGGIAIDAAGQYLYAGWSFLADQPGLIERLQLPSLTPVGSGVVLAADERTPEHLAMDPMGRFLLVGCGETPAKVVKVGLDPFAREGAGTLRRNLETGINALLVDAAGEFAFIGMETTPGRIVSFEIAPKPLRLGIFQYFGQFMLRKWQSEPMAVREADAWITVPIADGSPSQLTLEPGEYVLAWQFDADESGPSFTPGSAGAGIQAPLAFGEFPELFSQNFGSPTKWIDTASQWSAYVEFDAQARAKDWEYLN